MFLSTPINTTGKTVPAYFAAACASWVAPSPWRDHSDEVINGAWFALEALVEAYERRMIGPN